MKHDHYEDPNLTEKLEQAAKSSSLYANPISQSSGMSGMSMGMLQSSGSGGSGSNNMLEARVAKLESDVAYIRRDVDELKADVKSIDRNVIAVIERLDSIKESLANKPSSDAVDKKISDAKLAILLGVPAIIAIGTGLYKLAMHFYFNA